MPATPIQRLAKAARRLWQRLFGRLPADPVDDAPVAGSIADIRHEIERRLGKGR
jgi:hypothetical protein